MVSLAPVINPMPPSSPAIRRPGATALPRPTPQKRRKATQVNTYLRSWSHNLEFRASDSKALEKDFRVRVAIQRERHGHSQISSLVMMGSLSDNSLRWHW